MHEVLQTAELLCLIFDFCESSREADKRFAMVCQQWFGVYVYTRWRVVRDPELLLTVFEAQQDSLDPGRFDTIYGTRIHGLDFDEEKVDTFALDRFFVAIRRSERPLRLPGLWSLKFINVPHQYTRLEQISLLMNERITEFAVMERPRLNNGHPLLSHQFFEQFLLRISQRMPYLRQLELGVKASQHPAEFSAYRRMVSSLRTLRRIRLPSSPTLPDIQTFVESRDIESIAFGVLPARGSYFIGSDYVRSPITLALDWFSSLSELEVFCTIDEAFVLFCSFSNTRSILKNLTLSFPVGRSANEIPSPLAIRELHAVIAQSCPQLLRLSILCLADYFQSHITSLTKSKPRLDDIIRIDDLLPLTLCTNIISFVFEHVYPVSANSAEIGYLTSSWRNLSNIVICPNPILPCVRFPDGIKHPDWRVAVCLADSNPLISVVRIRIMDPPFVTPYSPRCVDGVLQAFNSLKNLEWFDPGPYAELPQPEDGVQMFRTGPETSGFQVREITSFHMVEDVGGGSFNLDRSTQNSNGGKLAPSLDPEALQTHTYGDSDR
ncbi:hypothetical protein VNI00_016136 [Paramarasmius palmivorus]|uniref:F-box domain-containing protein n=1 Tax=Paramarasmius palmivorus TaxID=297713 RepID=A0AAW0BH13_9AGAR